MKSINVVISAGGKGETLSKTTKETIPKSLRLFSGRPLISYQLENLLNFGVGKIFLSFNNRDQLELFREGVYSSKIPRADYSYGVHPYGHALNTFLDVGVRSFIRDSDFLWTWGDLYYTDALLDKMVSLYEDTGYSICCSNSRNYPFFPRPNKSYLSYDKTSSNKVVNCVLTQYSGQELFGLHVPILLRGLSVKYIYSLLENPSSTISLSTLLLKLVEVDSLYVVTPDTLVNVNTIEDATFLTDQILN